MIQAAGGDRAATDRLLPLVYEQLRKAAQMQMGAERADHTLSATALVHEAYLKLIGPREVAREGRRHFYAAAAEAMRRILIDRARTRHGRNPDARAARLEAVYQQCRSECVGAILAELSCLASSVQSDPARAGAAGCSAPR